jgi:WD40 repeat protein
LQSALQRFAKPWWQRRALRIFRDEASLSANPHLWSSITEALDRSAWFVLLMSPEAASSPWVNREVEYWLEHKGPDRIIPVLTEGEFTWDHLAGSLERLSSAPPALMPAFREEPRFVDLRWARSEIHLDLRDSRFRGAVADIASTIRNVPKDDLESEDVRQHRRTVRTSWAAGATVLVFAVAAVAAAVYANDQREEADLQRETAQRQAEIAQANEAEAEHQALVAEARGLSARANALAPTRLDLSLLLAVEGLTTHDSLETRSGLLTALDSAQYLAGFIQALSGAFFIDASADGRVVATVLQDGTVQLWDPSTWRPDGEPLGNVGAPSFLEVNMTGTHLAAGGDGGAKVWDLETGHDVSPTALEDEPTWLIKVSPSGDLMMRSDIFDPVWSAEIWRIPEGELVGRIALGDDQGLGGADFSEDGSSIYAAASGGRAAVFESHTLKPIVAQQALGIPTSWGFVASPRGDLIATSSVSPVEIRVLDASTLEQVGNPIVPRSGGRLVSLEFSGDGERLLAMTDDGSVAVIDPSRGLETETLTGRAGLAGGAVWLGASRILASSSGATMEWDLERSTVLGDRTAAQGEGVWATDDGTLLVVDVNGVITATSSDGDSGIVDLGEYCWTINATSDARLAAVGCQSEDAFEVVLVDVVNRAEVWRRTLAGPPLGLSLSPDGRLVAVAAGGGDVTVLETASGSVSLQRNLDSWMLRAVGWAPDGESLMIGGQHGSIYFLETGSWEQTAELVLEPNEIALMGIAVHPDGRRAFVSSESGVIWVIDASDRSIDGDPLDASGTQLQGVAVSPDGSLVVATSRDGGIRVWETESRRSLGPTLHGHAMWADAIDFGPQGLFTSGLESYDPETDTSQITTLRWELDSGALMDTACDLVGRNLTRAEWSEYVPEAEYRATCARFPSAP